MTGPSVPMLLPQFLAENIRACTRKIVHTSRSKVSEIDLIPILCRPLNALQLQNYVWGDQGNTVYTTLPSETPINIIDMSFDPSGTVKYLNPNGLQIQTMSDIWNQWIKSLGSFLSPLTTPAQTAGISILNVSTLTRTSKQASLDNNSSPFLPSGLALAARPAGMVKQSSKKFLGLPPLIREGYKASPDKNSFLYGQIVPVVVTSTNIPLASVWKYQRVMILPWFGTEPEVGGSGNIPARQVFQVEPFKISCSAVPYNEQSFDPQQSLLNVHGEMAELDVKTEFASTSEIAEELTALGVMGDGGFFTNLAGMFAEDVLGIKGGKAIAGAVGNAIGL